MLLPCVSLFLRLFQPFRSSTETLRHYEAGSFALIDGYPIPSPLTKWRRFVGVFRYHETTNKKIISSLCVPGITPFLCEKIKNPEIHAGVCVLYRQFCVLTPLYADSRVSPYPNHKNDLRRVFVRFTAYPLFIVSPAFVCLPPSSGDNPPSPLPIGFFQKL